MLFSGIQTFFPKNSRKNYKWIKINQSLSKHGNNRMHWFTDSCCWIEFTLYLIGIYRKFSQREYKKSLTRITGWRFLRFYKLLSYFFCRLMTRMKLIASALKHIRKTKNTIMTNCWTSAEWNHCPYCVDCLPFLNMNDHE